MIVFVAKTPVAVTIVVMIAVVVFVVEQPLWILASGTQLFRTSARRPARAALRVRALDLRPSLL